MAVHLEWVGMACFRLRQDGGGAIAMDPYTPAAIGLVDDGSKIQADTVIASSLTDVAHGNVGLIADEHRAINALVGRSRNSPATASTAFGRTARWSCAEFTRR